MRLRPADGIEAQVAVMETGTGSHTMIRRVVAEGLGLPLDRVGIQYVGTAHLPYDSGGWQPRNHFGFRSGTSGCPGVPTGAAAGDGSGPGHSRHSKWSGGGGVESDTASGAPLTLQLGSRGVTVETLSDTGVGQRRGASTRRRRPASACRLLRLA